MQVLIENNKNIVVLLVGDLNLLAKRERLNVKVKRDIVNEEKGEIYLSIFVQEENQQLSKQVDKPLENLRVYQKMIFCKTETKGKTYLVLKNY